MKTAKDLTLQERRDFKALADLGFLYSETLRKMPKDLSALYKQYFSNPAYKAITAAHANRLSSVSLAIAKGYTAQERNAYLEEKKKSNVNKI